MYGYVYESTCLVNGKKYIGQHKSAYFNSKYKGSGRILKLALKKYNKESQWSVRLIEECETAEELDKREEYWIDYYKAVEREDYYNILRGGSKNSYIVTQETKDKISEYNIGTINITKGQKNKRIRKEELDKYLSEGWKKGQYQSKLTKARRSKAQKERFKDPKERAKSASLKDKKSIYKDDIEKFVKTEELDKYLSEGWKLGKPSLSKRPYKMSEKRIAYFNKLHTKGLSEETKKKISDKNKQIHKENSEKFKHSEETKKKISELTKEALANKKDKMSLAAYNRFSNLEERRKQSERISGSRWMYKNDKCSQVHKDKIEQYIKLGWQFGRLSGHQNKT